MSAEPSSSADAPKSNSDFLGKRALITGGLGFIGSNLARRLVELGAEVTLVDNLCPEYGGNRYNIDGIESRVVVHVCDVRDSAAVSRVIPGQDFLFNLAAQTGHVASMLDPATDLEINTAAQITILEACRKLNPRIKIVFASTRQLYGRPNYLPVDEKHPIHPVDVNGINKHSGELYHLLYNDVYGVRACVLRLTNTFGPRMRVKDARQTFLGVWMRQIIEGRPITVFGDGVQQRDFTYVDDCVDAFLSASQNGVADGKVYNLGGREVVTLKDLARTLIDVAGEGSFELVPFPEQRKAIDIGDYYADGSLVKSEVGWEPTTPLAAGLKLTLDYFRKHVAEYWS